MSAEKTQPNRTLEELFIHEYEQLKAEKARLETQVKQNNMVIDELASQLTDIKEFIKKYGTPTSDTDDTRSLSILFNLYSWDSDSEKIKIYEKFKHLWPTKSKAEEKSDEE